MIISVNWLKQFTEINSSIDELVSLIGSRLVEVEDVINLGEKYENVLIADVKYVEKHPNADKLHVVHIDDGGAAKNVERLENGLVEVVCGAPNVREGLKVVWLPPGAVVPSTFGKEDFKLEARELRGVKSNGMIASAQELGVGEDHSGIVEVEKDVSAGSSFAETYELNDYLLDIENKSLTHRPDCFGLIGFAREVAAIQGKQFKTPDWLMARDTKLNPLAEDAEKLRISATVENSEIAPRYQLVALENVHTRAQSPFIIQTWLSRVGIKPISAVVDITNYLMYLTGQPTHAFDLDKVIAEHPEHKPEIIVRESKAGEKLTLLGEKTITLSDNDIVICAGKKPIGLAGAMGGASTEIDQNTKRVLVESASFDLFRLRSTGMRHGITSEAITRFTKGQSPVQTAPVLASVVRMLEGVAGARRVSDIIDEFPKKPKQPRIETPLQQLNDVIGTDFNMKQATNTLCNVEFDVDVEPDYNIIAQPPYWRADIHIPEDIIEEVGRINGFDNIEPTLPLRPYKALSPNSFDQTRSEVRHLLASAGANELLTYNFLSSNLLKKTGENTKDVYRLINSLSPELEFYRANLLPSLLAKVQPNHKLGYDAFALFELNKTHSRKEIQEDKLPLERDMLALAWSAADKAAKDFPGAAFYQAKRYLWFLAANLQISLEYQPLENYDLPEFLKLRAEIFEPKRSAVIVSHGKPIGIIGEITGQVRKNLKLPEKIAGFELDAKLFRQSRALNSNYQPLSRYPGTEKDVTLRVASDMPYAEIVTNINSMLIDEPFEAEISPVIIYQDPKDSGHKNVTVRLHVTSFEHTITTEEANALIIKAVAAVPGAKQA